MLRFLARLFRRAQPPTELELLARHLAGYAQRLTVAAIMLPNVEEALAEPGTVRPETLVGKGYIDWTVEAQIFLVSLVVEACVHRGFVEEREVAAVVAFVVAQGLKRPEANAEGMTATALQLRHLVLHGAGAEEQSDEVRRLIPIAAHGMERGEAVAARFAAGGDEPPMEELDDFVARFGGRA